VRRPRLTQGCRAEYDNDHNDDDGNCFLGIGWRMPRREVAGDIA
jgi:hypothetical protein